ncbi:hypothetical protein M514_19524 [Trichuris suis]|uniref:Uncharacterized protein n=1 Tax=Trichuris suis TaxID=68888 RepID=A0A085NFL6_9BILA|nr:hypothetical protein M514_19524 [Trichuris suis]
MVAVQHETLGCSGAPLLLNRYTSLPSVAVILMDNCLSNLAPCEDFAARGTPMRLNIELLFLAVTHVFILEISQ